MLDLLDVPGNDAEAETSDAGSRAAGLDDEAVIDAETAEEREEATDEGDGVGTEAVDDA